MHDEVSSPGGAALNLDGAGGGARAIGDGFWAALAARLLHPLQLQIIEAMRWIDQPLSVSDLVQIFREEHPLTTVAYHVRRLAAVGALTPVGRRRPVRGTTEKLYRLGLLDE